MLFVIKRLKKKQTEQSFSLSVKLFVKHHKYYISGTNFPCISEIHKILLKLFPFPQSILFSFVVSSCIVLGRPHFEVSVSPLYEYVTATIIYQWYRYNLRL